MYLDNAKTLDTNKIKSITIKQEQKEQNNSITSDNTYILTITNNIIIVFDTFDI